MVFFLPAAWNIATWVVVVVVICVGFCWGYIAIMMLARSLADLLLM